MLSIKRQIESEQERYGSFADITADSTVSTEREINDDLFVMRASSDKGAAVAAPAIEKKTEEAPIKVPLNEERHAYTQSTAQMHEIVRSEEKREQAVAKQNVVVHEKRLSASAKKAIAVYMSIVFALVLAVIITGVCVSSVNADIASIQSTISSQESTIADMSSQLVVDEADILEAAEEMGMVTVDQSDIRDYDNLELVEDSEDETGVFDSVRDWLNSFGG